MHTFSIKEALTFGWNTFKKYPLFLVGVFVVLFIVSVAVSAVTDPNGQGSLFGALVSFAIGLVGEMMMINLMLHAHAQPEKLKLRDLWSRFPLLYYATAKILMSIIVVLGLILLIVPGVIAALALMFSTYVVMDRNFGPIESLKESMRITKGHRLQLFFFVIVLALLNIAGVLALGVGLLVTVPISALATVHIYRFLEHKAGEIVPEAA